MNAPDSHPSLLLSHPVIVIGVPCYNEEAYLPKTLDSLKAQSWNNFAVLIADNASTDRSGDIAANFANDDPRFHCVRHDSNIGSAANFNFALDRTSSPYFLWLGAHDLLHPGFLAHHLDALNREPRLSVSQSTHAWIDEDDRHIEEVRDLGLGWGGPDSVMRYLASVRANRHNIGINSVIRRDMLEGTRFTGVIGTDRLILSCLAFRGPFNTIDKPLYLRRSFKSERGGFDGYMERLTGEASTGPDWDALARGYDKQASQLLHAHRLQRFDRGLLQLALRYYLPVGLGSPLTTALWAVRRVLKLPSLIARRMAKYGPRGEA